MKNVLLAFAVFLAATSPAYADQINSDRPGVGSSPEIVNPLSIQTEIGNDSKNIRLGITKNFELSKDQDSFGGKYKFVSKNSFDAAVKVSYAKDSTFIIELPTQISVNRHLSLGTDVILAKDSKTYVGTANLVPVQNFTITNSIYYDDKVRYGVFLAWTPPKHSNLQFDIGYDQGKIKFGISIGMKLHR